MLKDLIENNSDMRTDPEPEYCIVKTSLHVHQAEKIVDFLTSGNHVSLLLFMKFSCRRRR